MRHLSGRLCLLSLALSVAAGCGSDGPIPRAQVKGEVTWNGQPVEDGIVLFIPTSEGTGKRTSPVPAKISDGYYELDKSEGPLVGQHRIEIRAIRKTGKKTPEPTAAMKHFDPSLASTDITEQFLPEKFNDASTLQHEVESGENVIDFDLTEK